MRIVLAAAFALASTVAFAGGNNSHGGGVSGQTKTNSSAWNGSQTKQKGNSGAAAGTVSGGAATANYSGGYLGSLNLNVGNVNASSGSASGAASGAVGNGKSSASTGGGATAGGSSTYGSHR